MPHRGDFHLRDTVIRMLLSSVEIKAFMLSHFCTLRNPARSQLKTDHVIPSSKYNYLLIENKLDTVTFLESLIRKLISQETFYATGIQKRCSQS